MDFMFEDEVDEVGSDVEAYCPKCKGDTTHVVISKYEDEIRRVQCNPCGDVHSFRKPRGDVEDDVPEPIAAKKRAMMKKVTWEEFFHKHGEKGGKPYEFRELYHDNVIVTHPKFGRGFVSEVLSDSKVEITFKDSRRVLVHNRKDMPGLPLAAEGDGRPSSSAAKAPPAKAPPPAAKGKAATAKEPPAHAHKEREEGKRKGPPQGRAGAARLLVQVGSRPQGQYLAGRRRQEPQGGRSGARASRQGSGDAVPHRQAGARGQRLVGQALQGLVEVGRQKEQEVAESRRARRPSRVTSALPAARRRTSRTPVQQDLSGPAARTGRRTRARRPRRQSRGTRTSARSRVRRGSGT